MLIARESHLINFNDGPVLAEIKGELSNYCVSIEFDKNGKARFKSGQATDKSSARNIIKTKIAEGSARSLALDTPRGLSGQNTSAISIDNIAETLKLSTMKKTQKPTTKAHGMEAVWTLTSLTRKRPLPVPEVWYTAAAFTRRRIKRRPGCIKNMPKVRGDRHICTK